VSAAPAAVVPTAPPGVRQVREVPAADGALWVQPEWRARFPWLVQGTTGRAGEGGDLGLFGTVPTAEAQARWRTLRERTGMKGAAHARQVHGARVLWHGAPVAGVLVADDADGHATPVPGLLLTVSVADCVPISILDPGRRALALLHGGWRGVAGGILEAGMACLRERAGSGVDALELHCGPAICGRCYQVGPEVAAALGMEADGPVQLDLRAAIAARATAAGIDPARITLSGHCTRCGDGAFWSHRAGCRERQLGVLGIRAA
jgi:hypothetical protein